RGLALVEAREPLAPSRRVARQPGPVHQLGREHRGDALLAAAHEQLLAVLGLRPADRHAELRERAVERRPVAVALGLGEHAVAVEDERVHRAAVVLARTISSGLTVSLV